MQARGSWNARSPRALLRIVDLEGKQASRFPLAQRHDYADRYAAADTMKIPRRHFLSTGTASTASAVPLFTSSPHLRQARHHRRCCSAALHSSAIAWLPANAATTSCANSARWHGVEGLAATSTSSCTSRSQERRNGHGPEHFQGRRLRGPPRRGRRARVISNCPINNPVNDFTPRRSGSWCESVYPGLRRAARGPSIRHRAGRYTGDGSLPASCTRHFAAPKSRRPHRGFDIAEAAAAGGALGAPRQRLRRHSERWSRPSPTRGRGSRFHSRSPLLARERCACVGEEIALVLAGSPALALDAAERIVVEYAALRAAVGFDGALRGGAPDVHETVPGTSARLRLRDEAATASLLARRPSPRAGFGGTPARFGGAHGTALGARVVRRR